MKNKFLIRVGRPDKRDSCRTYILAFLKQSGIATVDYIRKELLQKKGISFAWATIRKYLNELIEENQIQVFEPNEPTRKKYKNSRKIYFYGSSMKEATERHRIYVKSNL